MSSTVRMSRPTQFVLGALLAGVSVVPSSMHWLVGASGELLPVIFLGAISFVWVLVVTPGRWPLGFIGGCACGALVASSVSGCIVGIQLSRDLTEVLDKPDPEARAALLLGGELWAVVLTVFSTAAAAVGSGVAAVVAAVCRREWRRA